MSWRIGLRSDDRDIAVLAQARKILFPEWQSAIQDVR